MRKFTTLAALLLVVAFCGSATAAPILLDNFNASVAGGNYVGTGSPANGSFPGFASPGNILGTRTISYTAVPAGNFATFEGLSVNTVADPGVLFVGTTTSALEVEAKYTGFGLLSLAGGILNIEFRPIFDPGTGVGQYEIQIQLGTTSGNLTLNYLVPPSFTPGAGLLAIPLTGFSGPGDIGNVNSIAVRFNDGGSPRQSSDFIVNSISLEVPEPATIAICGIFGVAGLVTARRKMKKSAEPTAAA